MTLRPRRTASFGVRLKASKCARAVESASSLLAKCRARSRANAAQAGAKRRQPLISIVGTQRESVFGARGEHAVGLADTLHCQIVDHHAEISVGAAKTDRLLGARPQCGVEARDQTLRRPLPRSRSCH